MPASGSQSDPVWMLSWPISLLDLGLVLVLVYVVLVAIGERRTLWAVRGSILLAIALAVAIVASRGLGLTLFGFLLEKIAIGCTVAIAALFQSELRLFLEQLGRGNFRQLFQSSQAALPKSDDTIEEIVDAIKELSQNRTGALVVLETGSPIDAKLFSDPGVTLNAEISKELIQTIFQTTTLLHDGAILIRGSRLLAAGVILPISDSPAPRQLGTRHRAAMGITERVGECTCIVVSEETGSISLAERGTLNRPLTRGKLKELLEMRFAPTVEREAVAPQLGRIGRRLGSQSQALFERLLRLPSSTSREKK